MALDYPPYLTSISLMVKKGPDGSNAKKMGAGRGRGRPPKAREEAATSSKGKSKKSVDENATSAIESAKTAELKAVSSEDLNRLVDKLVDLQRRELVDFAYRVGELVVKELFDGDAQLIHQPGPKEKALTRLANHPRLPFSPATLSRSVGVYELLERLPQFKNHKDLALGHLYAVLAAPEDKQERLLDTTIEKSWNVERLLKEVSKAHEKELGSKRGRPALPEGVKALNAVERVFKGETPLEDLSFIEELDKDQVEHIKEVVDKMRDWCTQAAPLIERRLKMVETEADEKEED